MAMSMMLRRLGVPVTWHGIRSSFRDWAAEQGVAFDLAEASLAHAIGSNVTRSYLRTSMLKLRRPVLASWASFVGGETRRQRGRASQGRGVIPVASSPRIKPRALGGRRGQARLAQLSRCGMTTPSRHNGEVDRGT